MMTNAATAIIIQENVIGYSAVTRYWELSIRTEQYGRDPGVFHTEGEQKLFVSE